MARISAADQDSACLILVRLQKVKLSARPRNARVASPGITLTRARVEGSGIFEPTMANECLRSRPSGREASGSARSLGCARHTVRPTAWAETVGLVQKGVLQEGGLAESDPEKKRQGDASASDSARALRCARHTIRHTLRAKLMVQDKRAASWRGPLSWIGFVEK